MSTDDMLAELYESNTCLDKEEILIPSNSNKLSIPGGSMPAHKALQRIDLNTVAGTHWSMARSVWYRPCSQWKIQI